MKANRIRVWSLLIALTVFLSCAGSLSALAVDAVADPPIETVVIGVDEKETGDTLIPEDVGKISIKAGDALKLIAVVTPESAADRVTVTEWRSEQETVASIDADGVVTTGPCTTVQIRYIPIITIMGPVIKIPVGVRFFGVTRIYMTASADNGDVFQEAIDLTVRHTFVDYLRWMLERR